MSSGLTDERCVIVGAGAAGLCAAFHARRMGLQPLIIDRAAEVGGAWREMPDSLRCLSPREYDRLPDGDFPDAPEQGERASRREVVAVLERFQRRHRFRVRPGEVVEGVVARRAGFELRTTRGALSTRVLVVATGEFGAPRTPSLPGRFDGLQAHYRTFSAADVRAGERVLVVGGGNSGADAALAALEAGARVTLATPSGVSRPSQAVAWLTRALQPLSRVPLRLLPAQGGCTHSTPVVGEGLYQAVQAGRIALADRVVALTVRGAIDAAGRALPADRIVWCTGFRRDTAWLAGVVPLAPETGVPRHREGVAEGVVGLGLLGIPCMRTRRSGFLRGFSDDAAALLPRLVAGR